MPGPKSARRVTSRVFLLTPAGFEILDGAEGLSRDPSFFDLA